MKTPQPHAYYYAGAVRVQPGATYDAVHGDVKDHNYANINVQDYPVNNTDDSPAEHDPAYIM